MNVRMKSFILGVALLAQTQMSAAQTTSVAQIPEAAKAAKTQKLHILFNLETSSNMYREDSVDREASTDFLLNPSYQLTDRYSLAAKSMISKEETGARNTTVSNTSISLKMKGIEIGKNASLSHSLTGILPTNEEARKTDRFQGAVAIGNGIGFRFLNVDSKYVITVQKNVHEFTVNADDSPNVEYSLKHDLSFDIELTPKLSLSPSGYYRTGWTYHNFTRNSYGLGLDLNFEAAKDFVIYVGSGNEGAAYKANGTESNIKAFDQNTSVLRAGLSYTY